MLSSSPTEAGMWPLLQRDISMFNIKWIKDSYTGASSWSWKFSPTSVLNSVLCLLLMVPGGLQGYRGSPGGGKAVCIKELIHFSIYFKSIWRQSVKLSPKRVASRNLANQASQQLLVSRADDGDAEAMGPRDWCTCPDTLGHSEGRMAVLPEAIRWRRRLQLSPRLCHYCWEILDTCFFQGTAVWLLLG